MLLVSHALSLVKRYTPVPVPTHNSEFIILVYYYYFLIYVAYSHFCMKHKSSQRLKQFSNVKMSNIFHIPLMIN